MSDEPQIWLLQLKFWLLLILCIPSVICSILILIHFYQQRRNLSIHHHVTVIISITSFIQITTLVPFALAYYQRVKVVSSTDAFCTWWNWWEYGSNGVLRFAVAWGSIDRHVLIFHSSLVATRRRKFLFHTLPMLVACSYPAIFYFGIMILNTCQKHWDYKAVLCLLPCYSTDQPNLAKYDFVGIDVFPIIIITVANISLIIRVVWQRRHGPAAAWRQQRKLTIQLLGTAAIYMIFWFPLAFNGFFLLFWPSPVLKEIQIDYFFYLLYMVPVLIPFFLLANIPELTKKFTRRQQTMTIAPLRTVTSIVRFSKVSTIVLPSNVA